MGIWSVPDIQPWIPSTDLSKPSFLHHPPQPKDGISPSMCERYLSQAGKDGGSCCCCCCSVIKSCLTLYDPMDYSTQASLPTSWSSPKFMSVESVMPSNHLILCRPPLLLPSVFPMIRVFSNELALSIRWPEHIFNFEQNYFQEIKSLCMVQQAPKELHGDKTF